MSASRHPLLNLLEVEGRQDPRLWDTPPLRDLRTRLSEDPYSFALVQDALEELSDTASEREFERGSSLHQLGMEGDLAAWQGQMENEALAILDTMGPECFRATMDYKDDDDDSEGSISERESETSHGEDGFSDVSSETVSSSGSDATEGHEALIGGGGDLEILGKGQKRRILAAAKAISEAAQTEKESRERQSRQQPRVPRFRPLKTGLKILELYTWSCMLSRFAYGMGWQYLEPITLPGWNIMNLETQREAGPNQISWLSLGLVALGHRCSASTSEHPRSEQPCDRREWSHGSSCSSRPRSRSGSVDAGRLCWGRTR